MTNSAKGKRRRGGWSALALATMAMGGAESACSGSDALSGDLGNGSFVYHCIDASDPACNAALNPSGTLTTTGSYSSEPNEFPAEVAVGSKFELSYGATNLPVAGSPTLSVASPEYLTSNGGVFQAIKAGYCGVLARSTVSGAVVDYTMVHISEIGSLSILEQSGSIPPSQVSLETGSTLAYDAAPHGMYGETLAGALDIVWTTSDGSVVHLNDGNPSASMSVVGVSPGTATITASIASATGIGATSASITIVVGGGGQ